MKTYTVIIETLKGSQSKYAYDEKMQRFKLKKLLPAGMVFPFDFGFIEGTKGEDDGPLDIIIIAEFNNFPGSALECRIIGAFKAEQKDDDGLIRNDRFIAIPIESVLYKKISSIDQLPSTLLEHLEEFFINYNKAEGKKFKVLQKIDASKACAIIDKNHKKNFSGQ
jgi:inorganic pyrophosphatase